MAKKERKRRHRSRSGSGSPAPRHSSRSGSGRGGGGDRDRRDAKRSNGGDAGGSRSASPREDRSKSRSKSGGRDRTSSEGGGRGEGSDGEEDKGPEKEEREGSMDGGDGEGEEQRNGYKVGYFFLCREWVGVRKGGFLLFAWVYATRFCPGGREVGKGAVWLLVRKSMALFWKGRGGGLCVDRWSCFGRGGGGGVKMSLIRRILSLRGLGGASLVCSTMQRDIIRSSEGGLPAFACFSEGASPRAGISYTTRGLFFVFIVQAL